MSSEGRSTHFTGSGALAKPVPPAAPAPRTTTTREHFTGSGAARPDMRPSALGPKPVLGSGTTPGAPAPRTTTTREHFTGSGAAKPDVRPSALGPKPVLGSGTAPAAPAPRTTTTHYTGSGAAKPEPRTVAPAAKPTVGISASAAQRPAAAGAGGAARRTPLQVYGQGQGAERAAPPKESPAALKSALSDPQLKRVLSSPTNKKAVTEVHRFYANMQDGGGGAEPTVSLPEWNKLAKDFDLLDHPLSRTSLQEVHRASLADALGGVAGAAKGLALPQFERALVRLAMRAAAESADSSLRAAPAHSQLRALFDAMGLDTADGPSGYRARMSDMRGESQEAKQRRKEAAKAAVAERAARASPDEAAATRIQALTRARAERKALATEQPAVSSRLEAHRARTAELAARAEARRAAAATAIQRVSRGKQTRAEEPVLTVVVHRLLPEPPISEGGPRHLSVSSRHFGGAEMSPPAGRSGREAVRFMWEHAHAVPRESAEADALLAALTSKRARDPELVLALWDASGGAHGAQPRELGRGRLQLDEVARAGGELSGAMVPLLGRDGRKLGSLEVSVRGAAALKPVTQLYAAFARADTNRSGSVSVRELGNAAALLGHRPQAEVLQLFARADADGSGELDWLEFCELMAQVRAFEAARSRAARAEAATVARRRAAAQPPQPRRASLSKANAPASRTGGAAGAAAARSRAAARAPGSSAAAPRAAGGGGGLGGAAAPAPARISGPRAFATTVVRRLPLKARAPTAAPAVGSGAGAGGGGGMATAEFVLLPNQALEIAHVLNARARLILSARPADGVGAQLADGAVVFDGECHFGSELGAAVDGGDAWRFPGGTAYSFWAQALERGSGGAPSGSLEVCFRVVSVFQPSEQLESHPLLRGGGGGAHGAEAAGARGRAPAAAARPSIVEMRASVQSALGGARPPAADGRSAVARSLDGAPLRPGEVRAYGAGGAHTTRAPLGSPAGKGVRPASGGGASPARRAPRSPATIALDAPGGGGSPASARVARYGALRDAFNAHDRDRSGFVSLRELKGALRAAGLAVTDAALRAFREADLNADEKLSFAEFCRLAEQLPALTAAAGAAGGGGGGAHAEGDGADGFVPPSGTSLAAAFLAHEDARTPGHVAPRELDAAMRAAGVPVDSPAARSLLASQRSAPVDFGAFEALAAQLAAAAQADMTDAMAAPRAAAALGKGAEARERVADSSVRAAFTAFDRDRNGFLSTRELRAALRAAGAEVSDAQSLALIREADVNSDGRLSLGEFERLAKQLPAAAQLEAVAMPTSYARPSSGAGRTPASRPASARSTPASARANGGGGGYNAPASTGRRGPLTGTPSSRPASARGGVDARLLARRPTTAV